MTTIVLIGPPGAGKSTLGDRLATVLGLRFADADAVCGPWYAELGWSVERLRERVAAVGYERAHAEWEPALAHAVEQLLAAATDTVVALGAGHTHVTDPALAARVAMALAGADRVVLVLPAPDPEECVAVLRARCVASKGQDWVRDGVDWLRRWCTDGADERFATETVFNAGETPEKTVARLVAAS